MATASPGASTSDPAAHSPAVAVAGRNLNPFQATICLVGYLGRLALMTTSALGAILRPGSTILSFPRQSAIQLDRLLALGMPLVGLVHVGMGSFLSMQAYFGATFMDGIGPVTGVGLIRNLAPLMTGFILAGVVSARYVAELGGAEAGSAEASRMVACRLAAASVAGPVLAIWGSLVGIAIGWLVANQMMGLTLPAFFDMFLEMLWVRDIVGIVVKGVAFGFMAALLACHEGLSRPVHGESSADLESIYSAACRAACLGGLAILFFNGGWFLLVYHAGPAFGPTVLTPPRD
jgi:phospholipid/cholesterol/gamma-HCH transport system permease protein